MVSDQEIEAAGSEDGDSSYIEDEDELQNESTRRHDPIEDEESLSLDDEMLSQGEPKSVQSFMRRKLPKP